MPQRRSKRKKMSDKNESKFMKNLKRIAVISIILMVILSLTSLFKINISGETVNLAPITLIVGIVAFFVTRKTNENINEGLNIKTIFSSLKDKKVILLVLMPVIMNVICFLIATIFVPEFIEHLKSRTDFLAKSRIPILIIELMISALGEEIAWRAFFQKQVSKVLPFIPSLIISSALFSLCHFSEGSFIVVLYDLLFILINAIFYGIVFKKTDNAYISAIAHFIANLFGTVAIMFL